uniref:ATP-dependent RNA helicase n=1 Tax=Timspurckia oligopyrenoides TaxID=708627 RepID=A0A7S0ZGZ8_9RHOD|mmetsp:Transcript_4868/g.8479  ORF Transcript_4868/g.8479 Transcript_4868/m.8479 type:complete len:470 (+) Transcript_4868:59-1468(+)
MGAADEFGDLGLPSWLRAVCRGLNMRQPTRIQKEAIPTILQARHKTILCAAATGSGKTAAYALPILTTLRSDPRAFHAVILSPTRELAVQIAEHFQAFGAPISLRIALVIGGGDLVEQQQQLAKAPHLIIATPGRLGALLRAENEELCPSLSRLRYVVLDEADELLTKAFETELGDIMKAISNPEMRTTEYQTLLFSATFSDQIKLLQQSGFLKNAAVIDLSDENAFVQNVSTIQQNYLLVPQRVKDAYLFFILSRHLDSEGKSSGKSMSRSLADSKSTIVFVSTCSACELIATTLQILQLSPLRLHSQMRQSERLRTIQLFRNGNQPILIATDLAARGLDVPRVSLVINYDIPSSSATYIHRIGRTARGVGLQATGKSISLVSERDIDRVKAIENYMNREILPLDDIANKEHVVMEELGAVLKAKAIARLKIIERQSKDGANEGLKRRKGGVSSASRFTVSSKRASPE